METRARTSNPSPSSSSSIILLASFPFGVISCSSSSSILADPGPEELSSFATVKSRTGIEPGERSRKVMDSPLDGFWDEDEDSL